MHVYIHTYIHIYTHMYTYINLVDTAPSARFFKHFFF